VPMLPYYALWFSPRAAHVCTFHMYVERQGLVARTLRHAAAAALLRGFERGIAVSAPAAELAAPSWGRPLSVIANGVPTSTFTPGQQRERTPTPEDPLRLLFVGHWRDPRKGLPILLEALDSLRAQGLPVRLDVVGAGEAGASRPAVTFHGPVAAETALADHYRRCDLFVAPATGQESFGIVLLEAMACGRPIVCSDIPGYRQVVDPSGARLVAPGEPGPLAAAIRDLAAQPELRRTMGARNRLRSAQYDWDRLSCRVREEYVAALAIRQGKPLPILENASA
jgi:phosphatidylinositol alpha-mannosyltransferase